MGVIYIQDRDYQAAEVNFKKAIRLNPSYVDPYYNMACLYSLTGELNQAAFYLKKAIAINPEVREWAFKDSDMKALRASTEFQENISDK
jgi:Tfp pilus assembly protein PilF